MFWLRHATVKKQCSQNQETIDLCLLMAVSNQQQYGGCPSHTTSPSAKDVKEMELFLTCVQSSKFRKCMLLVWATWQRFQGRSAEALRSYGCSGVRATCSSKNNSDINGGCLGEIVLLILLIDFARVSGVSSQLVVMPQFVLQPRSLQNLLHHRQVS